MAEDGGKVNLFRDLDVLMEVPRASEGQGGAETGQGQERRHLKKGFQKKKAGGGGGGAREARAKGGAAAKDSSPRPSLKDPDLYMALMKECSREEQMDPGQEYVANLGSLTT